MINKIKYEQLLNNTIKNINKDDIRNINELLIYIDENKPKSLFRYRSCNEQSIEAFRENKIFFNIASNFNDPYDCLIYCDIDKILNQVQNIFDYKNIENLHNVVIDESHLNTRPVNINKETAQQIINNFKNKNIKDVFSNISEESIDYIKNFIKNLTPNILENYKNYYQNNQPLACLSETYNNILMWSHYADNHKGFVIEYETEKLKTNCMPCPNNQSYQTCPNWKQIMLLPILYTNKRYDATNYIFENTIIQTLKNVGVENVFQLSDNFAQYKINIHKHKCWSYEKEWRLQLFRLNNENFITVKPKAIYLGCKISKFYEDILVKYASEQNIGIFKMYENPKNIRYSLTKKKYTKNLVTQK